MVLLSIKASEKKSEKRYEFYESKLYIFPPFLTHCLIVPPEIYDYYAITRYSFGEGNENLIISYFMIQLNAFKIDCRINGNPNKRRFKCGIMKQFLKHFREFCFGKK